MYALRGVIVRPCGWAAAGKGSAVSSVILHALFACVSVVLAAAGISMWESSVLEADICNQSPFCCRHKVPALALAETSVCRFIVGKVRPRFLIWQAVWLPVNFAVRVD